MKTDPIAEAHSAGEDNEAVFGELLVLPLVKIKELTEQAVLR